MKRNFFHAFLLATIGLVTALFANFTWASDLRDIPGYPTHIEAYDAREVALLPRYCIYTQLYRDRVPGGNNPAEIKRWYSLLGKTFHAMHHYCWGLMRTNRALLLVRTTKARDYYLDKAILDFDYVIDRAPSDFILLPELLTKKGENLIRLGRGPVALSPLERAIELKPDYWPPYVALSDYYKNQGDLRKARELLEGALSRSPEAKPVQKRLVELRAVPRKLDSKP